MIKPDKYVFPAVFTYEDGYEIAVTFPDLPGCATSGETEGNALEMAKDVLGGHLWCLENDGDEIPSPSKLCDLELGDNERSVLIEIYIPSIRLSKENHTVALLG